MNAKVRTDITHGSDAHANALLCCWNEVVFTAAGQIEVAEGGKSFVLTPTTGKPREFATASGAIEVLRRISK